MREKIAASDFQARGADISADEIFVSDGAKCDTGNIQELFATDIRIAIPDPVYPVYVDTNVMAGRTGDFDDGRYEGLIYLESTRDNGFVPDLPARAGGSDLPLLSQQPHRGHHHQDQPQAWVDYARENKALILYDAAYEVFHPRRQPAALDLRNRRGPGGGHRIQELFQNRRIYRYPLRLYRRAQDLSSPTTQTAQAHSLHSLWNRRHTTKFNGVSYPVQRAAEAVYSDEGQAQVRELIDYYLKNAALIRREMTALGLRLRGRGKFPLYLGRRPDAIPGSFSTCCSKRPGWSARPGAGFGRCGEGYIRISAFNPPKTSRKPCGAFLKR